MSEPLVTLMTDFGGTDTYVAQMKGVILGIAPAVRIIDVTHQIPPQNVFAAARALCSTLATFPPLTIHGCIVDPGVGSDRRFLLAEIDRQFVIAPDNGLISLAVRNGTCVQIHEMTEHWFRRHPFSATFHGRDLVAPAIGHLALGIPPQRFGPLLSHPAVQISFPNPVRTLGSIRGEVVTIDHFGNLLTNISPADWIDLDVARLSVTVESHRIAPLRRYYAEVSTGELIALVSSDGFLEIAQRNGNAASLLGAECGTVVEMLIDANE